jgi:hypothetical protein
VVPVNDPPLAADDQATTIEGVPVPINVVDNDTDVDGNLDPSTVCVILAPNHGSVAIEPSSGTVTYTSALGFVGMDSFTYQVSDTGGLSATAVVTVEVLPSNYPPKAQDDSATTDEDTPVSIDVLANDSDADGGPDPGSVKIVVSPVIGSVTVDPASGAILYTPGSNLNGIDLLAYEVRDTQGAYDIAIVTVHINPINDPPVANDDMAIVNQGTSSAIEILANDTDVDDGIDRGTISIAGGPEHGTTTINSNGIVVYDPAEGYFGPDSFTYTVGDAAGAVSNVATVSIHVNAPPVAADDSYQVLNAETLWVQIPGVLGNDTDADGDTLVAVLLSGGPAHGSLDFHSDGSFSYTPETGFAGIDQFTYLVTDRQAESNPATATIHVLSANNVRVSGRVFDDLDNNGAFEPGQG